MGLSLGFEMGIHVYPCAFPIQSGEGGLEDGCVKADPSVQRRCDLGPASTCAVNLICLQIIGSIVL